MFTVHIVHPGQPGLFLCKKKIALRMEKCHCTYSCLVYLSLYSAIKQLTSNVATDFCNATNQTFMRVDILYLRSSTNAYLCVNTYNYNCKTNVYNIK